MIDLGKLYAYKNEFCAEKASLEIKIAELKYELTLKEAEIKVVNRMIADEEVEQMAVSVSPADTYNTPVEQFDGQYTETTEIIEE